MTAFTNVVYPAVLLAMVVVLVAGAVAYVAATRAATIDNPGRFARLLTIATWVARSATGLEIVAIGALLGAGVTHPPMVMLIGYLVAAVAVLGLLGISRLGAPSGTGESRDPNQPVLSPRQMVQADGVAAMVVGVALAVVAWRLNTIVLAG
jgi:hypothetical protein